MLQKSALKKSAIVLAIILFSCTSAYGSSGWLLFLDAPFGGTIINAKTLEPIEGAVVVAVYRIRTCGPFFVPHCGTDAIDFSETTSASDGKFYIYPDISFYPWPFTLGGEESRFYIYKPGYEFTEVGRKHIIKKNVFALEPVPKTYYRRYEEFNKVSGIFGLDKRKTKVFKGVLEKEEAGLKDLDTHPTGVIYHEFVDDKQSPYSQDMKALVSPMDIVVDGGMVLVGDGFGFPKIHYLDSDGNFLDNTTFSFASGADIALASKDEDYIWGFVNKCLREFAKFKKIMFFDHDRTIFCDDKFPYTIKKFKVHTNGNVYAIGRKPVDPLSFFVLDKDAKNKLHEFPAPEGRIFSDVAIGPDAAYVAHFNINYGKGVTVGFIKFGLDAVPIVQKDLPVDRYIPSVSIAIDLSGIIYLGVVDEVLMFDRDLNQTGKIDFKKPEFGEVDLAAITIDPEAKFLYAIDRKYNRVLKYDLVRGAFAPSSKGVAR